MKKILLILFVFISIGLFSQSRLEKYWYYRKRLTDYFVKVGPNIGESIVAEQLNNEGGKEFKIGDGTIDLGWYISVLATEYALLKQNNQNTNETLQELYYAMRAYERLDLCEDKPPWNKSTAELDVFFNRSDEEIFDYPDIYFSLEGRNKGLTPNDIWGSKPPGHPTWINELEGANSGFSENKAMSQDQVAALLMGFALVKRSFNDENVSFYDLDGNYTNINFNSWARYLADLLVSYIKSNGTWIIKDPNGEHVPAGDIAIANSFGFAMAGSYITGIDYQDAVTTANIATWLAQPVLYSAQNTTGIGSDYNATMAMTLAAIGNSWETTQYNLWLAGGYWGKQHLFIPLYSYLWGAIIGWPYYNKKRIKKILDDAPCGGPYFWGNDNVNFNCCGSVDGNPGGGWAYKNRFRGDQNKINFGGGDNHTETGNFNGLDYMLLYNLYHLKENPTPYVDLRKRYFSESLPQTYIHIVNSEAFDEIETGSLSHPLTIQAFSEIESRAKLDNIDHRTKYKVWRTKIWVPTPTWLCPWCGHWSYIIWYSKTTYENKPTKYADLTLKAKDRIVLKSGFLVKKGSHFLAKIEGNYCGSSLYKKSPYVTAYDSAHWNNLKPDLITEDSIQYNIPDFNVNTINKSNFNKIEIYPNPTHGNLKITSQQNTISQITITNVSGIAVFNKQDNQKELEINISNLQNGVYFVKVITEKGKVFTEKIVKE